MTSTSHNLSLQVVRTEWERRCREDPLLSRGGLPSSDNELPDALLVEVEHQERWRLTRAAHALGNEDLSLSQSLGQAFLLGEVFCEHLDHQSLPPLMKGLRLMVEIVTTLHLGSVEDTAGTDRLTGLPNGRALDADLDALLDNGATETFVVVIDLDGLKVANDEFGGHPEGDRYIRRFAAGLQEVVRQHGGRAYRWHEGGDEFCVIFQEIDGDQVGSIIEGHRARSDVAPFCFGLAAVPDDGVEREALTSVADERLNAMKQERSQVGRAAEARDWLANEGWIPSR